MNREQRSGFLNARRQIAPYGSAVLLAIAATALIAGSRSLSRETATGIGLVLLGAAITRAVDIAQQRGRDAAEEKARRLRDADEVRRLAYMLKIAAFADHPELVASLANALAHHGFGVPPNEALGYLVDFDGGDPNSDRYDECEAWLQAIIDRITADEGPARSVGG